jgi:nucleoside-diphosphate-sugar epimerase
MAEKRILVTGATGFIGRHVIPLLIEKDFEVHGVYFGDSSPSPVPGCKFHKVNILDSESSGTFLSDLRPDYLLHLAWEARPGIYWTSSTNLDWAQASAILFRQFFLKGGRRGVSAGTCAEYRWGGRRLYSERTTALKPATLYGACKLGFAQMIDAYARQEGYSFAWGRVFFTFGPGEYPQRLVPSVIRSLLRNETARTTNGLHIRDFMYVDDVARAFVALLEADCRGPVNIASGTGIRIADIVIRLGQLLGRSHLVHLGALPSPKNEPDILVADTKLITKNINFKPQYSVDAGLHSTISWWKLQQGISDAH